MSGSRDIQDVYTDNPTTTIPNDALLYLGLPPYASTDNSAIKSQDIFPSSATDNAITRYNGTSGKKIQNSGSTLDDNDLLTTVTLKVSSVSSASVGGYFIGSDRYISDYGASPGYNLFVGKSVGNTTLNTGSSVSNCGVGSFMLTNLTTGAQNTIVGVSSGTSITSSSSNTIVGYLAFTEATSGSGQNTAIGANSLKSLDTGTNNSCLGYNSGVNYLTTESNNICIGNDGTASDSGVIRIGTSGTHTALYISNFIGTAGTRNFFSGSGAGNSTVTGTDNFSGGFNALAALTSGNNNVSVGSAALDGITSAGANVAVGKGAGTNLITGSTNTLLGHIAGSNYTGSESNNICIRNLGVVGESNVIRIGIEDGATHTSCYIAGIQGVSVSNKQIATINTSTGQMGSDAIIASSNGGTGNGFTKFTGPTTAEKTFTLPNASDTIACLGQSNTFTKAQGCTPATVTSSSNSVATDASLSNNFKLTMTENTTLANPTNMVNGFFYQWRIIQDSTPRTLAFGNKFKFPGGSAMVISTGSGAVDVLTGYYDSTSDTLDCVFNQAFS